MHFALVTDEYCAPSQTTRGTAIQSWSIMQAMLKGGHDVTAIIVTDKPAEHFDEIARAGVSVRTLPFGDLKPYEFGSIKQAFLKPRMETFYPWVALAPAMQKLLDQIRPNAVLAYNLYNLAPLHGVKGYPKMAVFVDLDDLVAHYRWLETPMRPLRHYLRATAKRIAHLSQWRYMKELLGACESVVNFAAHHADWLRDHGFPKTVYVACPTREQVGRERALSTAPKHPGQLPRVLLIGHLGGIATISGIMLFLKQALPRIEQKLGKGAFEVHVVGDYSKHPALAKLLVAESSVRVRGYVDDVNAEFLETDVLLVPTPIHLGTRTRIIEGFSYGCCVVAHDSNALGIPQLVDGENGLLSADGPGLGDAVARALSDNALRERLRVNARDTYEKHFTLETAGAHLIDELVKIAKPVAAKAVA